MRIFQMQPWYSMVLTVYHLHISCKFRSTFARIEKPTGSTGKSSNGLDSTRWTEQEIKGS